jgi:predicted PP-loop superfamily ATPase
MATKAHSVREGVMDKFLIIVLIVSFFCWDFYVKINLQQHINRGIESVDQNLENNTNKILENLENIENKILNDFGETVPCGR